ncbi:MAG: methyltransferase domain-containing protein, partial [Thermoleophilia bacterium]|nr:methyltransferase domain-containing protein [Thermoleophilia bacterium]
MRAKAARQRVARLRAPSRRAFLRRTAPVSTRWGKDRGTGIDRYYIERFLERHQADVRGAVLEVKDSGYTERFGTGVARREVVDIDAANERATIVADLGQGLGAEWERTFDCFILTQTLQYLFEPRGAIESAFRVLKPGGALLVTVPFISRWPTDPPPLTDYWRFTPPGCETLFAASFGEENVDVEVAGNVLTASAFLYGLACEDLDRRRLDENDPSYPV